MATKTLRELTGLDETPAKLAESTLILVDYQNTYTRGELELEGWRAALDTAAELLARAREVGAEVIHVVHDGGEGSLYDVEAWTGGIHPDVAPTEGERVVRKKAPDAFVGTDLGDHVDAAGHQDVVVIGFMTHMCVTFTAQGAFLRGNRPTVVANACASRGLPVLGAELGADQVHSSGLAVIRDLYGVVVASGDSLG
ncbi:cysteine hydrolase family protein [Streptomyces sp. NPDC002225]|uniref:cysteine hydrolase family protein n=1 Tax=Streptomyces sp. NPDC002225 TaxID=3154413 RepID=UPI003320DA1C